MLLKEMKGKFVNLEENAKTLEENSRKFEKENRRQQFNWKDEKKELICNIYRKYYVKFCKRQMITHRENNYKRREYTQNRRKINYWKEVCKNWRTSRVTKTKR